MKYKKLSITSILFMPYLGSMDIISTVHEPSLQHLKFCCLGLLLGVPFFCILIKLCLNHFAQITKMTKLFIVSKISLQSAGSFTIQ